MTDSDETFDLAIIGAGPAGMAAAIEARRHGLRLVVLDENASPGGQIYRAVGRTTEQRARILGRDYAAGAALVGAFGALDAHHRARATVWMIEQDGDGFCVGIRQERREGGGADVRMLHAAGVIIANGALERPCPIPGWTLPGVMTAGAAQSLLKGDGLVPAGRTLLAGSGPLLYLLAQQLMRAGAPPDAVLDTTPMSNLRAALPHLPAFLTSAYARKGAALAVALWRSGKVITGVQRLSALGGTRLEGVSFHRRGAARTLPADTLLLHQGVVPQLNLAMSAGCAHRWHSGRVAFEPVVDAWFESSIPGLHVVGDGAGIGGADAAVFRGRLAALATAARLGSVDLGTRDRLGAGQRSLAQKAMRGRRFLDLLFKPAVEFRVPADSTIVCRCEDVTAGAVRSAVACGAQGPNQVKAFVRAGMGPCQARQCGLTVCETIADARGLAPGDIGHVHLRNPVKPITVGDLAGLSRSGDPKSGSHRLF